MMDDTTERALEWLTAAGAILPAAEYATALAETARGAEEMRPGIIERVGVIARSGESYDGSDRHAALLGAVTTLAFIDAACGRPPVRLVYTRAYTPVPPAEEESA
jgi:hypothetical protein